MTSEHNIAEWLRMYNSLTDPRLRAEAKRKTDLEKRKAERMKDTGYTSYERRTTSE